MGKGVYDVVLEVLPKMAGIKRELVVKRASDLVELAEKVAENGFAYVAIEFYSPDDPGYSDVFVHVTDTIKEFVEDSRWICEYRAFRVSTDGCLEL